MNGWGVVGEVVLLGERDEGITVGRVFLKGINSYIWLVVENNRERGCWSPEKIYNQMDC